MESIWGTFFSRLLQAKAWLHLLISFSNVILCWHLLEQILCILIHLSQTSFHLKKRYRLEDLRSRHWVQWKGYFRLIFLCFVSMIKMLCVPYEINICKIIFELYLCSKLLICQEWLLHNLAITKIMLKKFSLLIFEI